MEEGGLGNCIVSFRRELVELEPHIYNIMKTEKRKTFYSLKGISKNKVKGFQKQNFLWSIKKDN